MSWQRNRRKRLAESLLQLFPSMVDAFLVGVENNREPRHIRLLDLSRNGVQQVQITFQVLNLEGVGNGVGVADRINNVPVVFALDQKDAFLVHYRTSVSNPVAWPIPLPSR